MVQLPLDRSSTGRHRKIEGVGWEVKVHYKDNVNFDYIFSYPIKICINIKGRVHQFNLKGHLKGRTLRTSLKVDLYFKFSCAAIHLRCTFNFKGEVSLVWP